MIRNLPSFSSFSGRSTVLILAWRPPSIINARRTKRKRIRKCGQPVKKCTILIFLKINTLLQERKTRPYRQSTSKRPVNVSIDGHLKVTGNVNSLMLIAESCPHDMLSSSLHELISLCSFLLFIGLIRKRKKKEVHIVSSFPMILASRVVLFFLCWRPPGPRPEDGQQREKTLHSGRIMFFYLKDRP